MRQQGVEQAMDIRTDRQAEEAGVAIEGASFASILEGQNVTVRKNSAGAEVVKPRLNLIEGANITITLADDPVSSEADITIASSAVAADPTFTEVSPAQITADQNNYNPGTGSFHRLSTDAARTITGFVAEATGSPMFIANVGAFNLVIANESASSTAANRVITGTGADVTLNPDDSAIFLYDGASARWRMF